MSDDNVIRPIFGRPRADTTAGAQMRQNTISDEDEIPDHEQDLRYFLLNLKLVWKAHLRGDEMTNFLFDVAGYQKSDSSLDLRRPIVRNYTFEYFCDRLLNSSRGEWSSQPAFFGALFIEFHARQNIILSLLETNTDAIVELTPEDTRLLLNITVRASTVHIE